MGNPYAMGEIEKYLARWWFQPTWQNISQNGSFAQLGVKIENIWNHHLVGEYPPRKKQTTWDPPLGKARKIPIDSQGAKRFPCDRCQEVPILSVPCYHQEFQVPKMEGFLNLMTGYFGGGFPPKISLTYSLYGWGFLHFRYLKSLVMLSL